MADKDAAVTGQESDKSKEQGAKYNREALKRILTFSPLELLAGLLLFASRWETGDVKVEETGRKFRNKIEAQLALDYLKSRKEYNYGVEVLKVPEETKERVFEALVDLGAPVHYTKVASHRRAIKRTAEILVDCKAIPEMLPQYLRHDMSKYGPFEVIGYSVMFSCSSVFQKLDGVALEEWTKSVQSHYRDNPHHPEFWGKNDMPEDALIESVVDMLACRLERDFKWNEVSDFCTVDAKFQTRYTKSDQEKISVLLDDYYKRAVTFLGK